MNKNIFLLVSFVLTISCGTQKKITEKDLLYKSTPENLDKFGSFIWSKNENDSIIINEKNLDIIKLKKGSYSKSLIKYTSYLSGSNYKIKNIKFSERSSVLAHIIFNIKEIEYNEKHYSLIEDVIYNDEDLRYYNEFEKNNYYNLPNFKKEYREKFEKLKPRKKRELKPVINIIRNEY